MIVRKLKDEEIALITWMIKDTIEGQDIINKLSDVNVKEMNDGGMGSLKVIVEGKDDRAYSRVLAEADFSDVDQVPVFISVILDSNGKLFELEVFKGDFSPLKRFPLVPQ
ncbi:DUF6984 family protein [Pedobacter cryoconitis]|uniref:DUF6984 family protein n=1 Tax=Pedobacter cryoconitis TaxID=188932 RepID=UPI00160D4CCA|nr:hypothetical protein [Pedobacter cryoconitis]MBB5647909.1 hypothetical protein [Pedobacter cryoconitis]